MLTEAQAKDKLCQETFKTTDYSEGHAHMNMPGALCCIASDCMAWRWEGGSRSSSLITTRDKMVIDEKSGRVSFHSVYPVDGDSGWNQVSYKDREKQTGFTDWSKKHYPGDASAMQIGWSLRRGYCGKAGTP